ncbi:MAG: ribonuclease III [Bryobacteraceae bacterium]|nr:ribonuclease III [Bryobacteraceae bacterium]
MSVERKLLEAALGYEFRNPELLLRALTHKSHAHEKPAAENAPSEDNEQLEFLGDSILGFLISEFLIERHPNLAEGRLSKLKARLVSAAHLHSVALRLELGRFLLLGKGEQMSGGREKPALLADAVEALIAAIYLDGGIEAAREFVRRHVAVDLEAILPLVDYKSALQEFAQARGLPTPRYVLIQERGPEHAKSFTVEVRVGDLWSAQAEDHSKKTAGQQAARLLLDQLTSQNSQ